MKKKDCYSTAFNSMFREYDIRGHVSKDELCADSVYRIVKAYSYYLRDLGIQRAVVGFDNRACSQDFETAAIKALRECGIDVFDIGLTLTPVVYFAQYYFKCEGAVMITASHNPSDWSGFKLAKGYSETLGPDDVKQVYNYLDYNDGTAVKMGEYQQYNIRDEYIENVVSRIKMGPNKPKVVLDAANGGAGIYIYEVFQRLGCMTFQLHCDPDMSYPNYFPNPSDIKGRKKLQSTVLHPYIKADIGLSFDGDGDRIGVVDDKGQNIWSDIILAVLAKQLLQRKKNAKIVYDVKCSNTLTEVVKQNSGIPVMWKTGHSYIKSKMHEIGADLAGERSGHIFIGGDDYYGFDDAVFVAAKLVEYLSNTDKKISEVISEFPQYITSPEIKASCADNIKYGVVDKIAEELKAMYPGQIYDINGARVQFEDGWGLVRASSNLPEIVLIFESKTLDGLKHIRKIFKNVLNEYPEVSSNWMNDINSF